MSRPEHSDLRKATASAPVLQVREKTGKIVEDALVVEEPLEIRLGGRAFSVTMRTPGQDYDLVRGLLFTEGIIRSKSEIGAIQYCHDESSDTGESNIINVHLAGVEVADRLWQRNLMAGSSCGLCGKATIEALSEAASPVRWSARVRGSTLSQLPGKLRSAQVVFERTGGLHAAGIFDTNGEALAICEDIGRHNATDKAIGRGLDEGWIPANEPLVLFVSGRASFEIVQKALMAQMGFVASVSAASHLAVELAEQNNIVLIGFLRDSAMTVYTLSNRVVLD
ncbi:MAG: formate dehydrogenase accessory sulfurtransferase FdhD [Armatimonadetes bacterium]|nr:formate dehydrogenase accessory sulfurtransferase FdhD [Armatimonadota bacterium]